MLHLIIQLHRLPEKVSFCLWNELQNKTITHCFLFHSMLHVYRSSILGSFEPEEPYLTRSSLFIPTYNTYIVDILFMLFDCLDDRFMPLNKCLLWNWNNFNCFLLTTNGWVDKIFINNHQHFMWLFLYSCIPHFDFNLVGYLSYCSSKLSFIYMKKKPR